MSLLFSDVSFKVGPGQHAGLVGAIGVGKTTLFRMLAGQLPAAAGDVHIGPLEYMPQDVGIHNPARARSPSVTRPASPRYSWSRSI